MLEEGARTLTARSSQPDHAVVGAPEKPVLSPLPKAFKPVNVSQKFRYVASSSLEIRRIRKRPGFVYRKRGAGLIRDRPTLRRIKELVIPPAWNEVRISAHANAHLQAIGQDARGRRQYLYHPRWRQLRDARKYGHMISFAKALPKIRRQVHKELRKKGLSKTKVMAAVVRLLELSCIRIGNEEYRRANRSFGLTTFRDQHVEVRGKTLQFDFQGKSGKQHSVELRDARLARIVGRCRDLPGQELFQFLDEQGRRRKIESKDVNQYLREISGGDFTAKDFRTWKGTLLLAAILRTRPEFRSPTEARRNVRQAIQEVATHIGNTPAVCRKSYVHPVVIDAYVEGFRWWTSGKQTPGRRISAQQLHRSEEMDVLRLLQRNR